MSGDFVQGKLTHAILSVAFEVHNCLGCGFIEKVYENALIREFKIRKIICENQKPIQNIVQRRNSWELHCGYTQIVGFALPLRSSVVKKVLF
jgi:GxxExxY protein